MSTILIKDTLRQAVEAASGGAQTVLYTAKNQPTYMNIIEKFDLSKVSPTLSGTHPAFIIDGKEHDVIYIGTYQGVLRNGELLSLPNQATTVSVAYDDFLMAAKANGKGHHLITNAEWSALALYSEMNKTQPKGNTYYGQSVEASDLFGRRTDGKKPGDASSTLDGRTFTGSGPVEWRHNGQYNGVSDLSGNAHEICSGARLVNGELQIIVNNNAASINIDMSSNSMEWKAIDGRTGLFIQPNGLGTTPTSVKYTDDPLVSADFTLRVGNFGSIVNTSVQAPVQEAALNVLRTLLFFPVSKNPNVYGGNRIGILKSGEVIPARGGTYREGLYAGIYRNYMAFPRASVNGETGSRPAFYKA